MSLITGASGRVAQRTAALLAERKSSLRLMSGTPVLVPTFEGVEVVAGDFEDPPSLDKAFVGITSALIISFAAGEQAPVTQTHRHLTGKPPQTLEEYFAAFPDRLGMRPQSTEEAS